MSEISTTSTASSTLSNPEKIPPDHSPKSPKTPLLWFLLALLVLLGGTGGIYLWQQQRFSMQLPVRPSPQVPLPTPSDQTTALIFDSHNQFGFDIFSLLNQDSDQNVFISPTSIALALSMALNGAQDETQTAISKTLYFDNLTLGDVNATHAQLIETLGNPDPKVSLAIANSIWTRKGMDFHQAFLQTNSDYYKAEVQSLDFASPQSVETINEWVNKNTNNKIPTIIDSISPEMVMYLINAVYFNGTWTYQFDKQLTEERDFTTADGQIKKHPFMKQTQDNFSYTENDQFAGVLLPYGENKRLGMYVLLPKANLDGLLSELTADNWKSWVSEFQEREGTLLLPKFKLEYKISLNDTLKELGMAVAFDPTRADFTKILARSASENLYISEVIHKTFVDVKEEGTEAAAVTSVGIGKTSIGPDDTFYLEVNRPFVFAIADSVGEILFLGAIRNPEI